MLLSVQNLYKSFGGDPLLKDVSFQMEDKDRLAIVGNNGTGKSTLLKILAGEENLDSGEIAFKKDIEIGYLPQYQHEDDIKGISLIDLLINEREDLISMEKELRQMEDDMSKKEGDSLSDLLFLYHEKTEEFENAGGLTFRSEAKGILKGLGFSEDEFKADVSLLSGGQKTRAALSRLLMKAPDLLMLDEPINHLDLFAIEWLENYLSKYKGAVIIIAHDRYFLDKISDHVLDLLDNFSLYKGNYTSYIKQKEEKKKALLREYEKQQKNIKHQEDVIKKLKQFNREKSIKRAESREKMLKKIEDNSIERPNFETEKMSFDISPEKMSGNDVLSIEDLKMQYGDKILFSGFDMEIKRGQRVGIIGDNGTGKTTLLKIINSKVVPERGTITFGTNVVIGYYDQEQQALSDEKTIFSELQDEYPDKNDTEIRNVLAAFLFTGDDVFKKIKMLSGGERGRVALSKLMMRGANFLILDEPTNHLDMESKEILENALLSYEGTILFVSHDRYFINRLSTDIYELSENKFTHFLGNYDYYLLRKEYLLQNKEDEDQKKQEENESKKSWQDQKKEAAKKKKKEQEIKKTEDRIFYLEEKKSEKEELFNDPKNSTNSAFLNELTEDINKINDELDFLYSLWDSLSEN